MIEKCKTLADDPFPGQGDKEIIRRKATMTFIACIFLDPIITTIISAIVFTLEPTSQHTWREEVLLLGGSKLSRRIQYYDKLYIVIQCYSASLNLNDFK